MLKDISSIHKEEKMESIYPKLNKIEEEIQRLRILVMSSYQIPKKLVSLKGMGKLLVSEKELEKSIREAKMTL